VSVVIRLIELADGRASEHEGAFVFHSDPHGELVTTRAIERAKRYEDFDEAMQDYRRGTGRMRPDGKPDRPMTAWTIEIVGVR
jgi:hypothetical protein